ncbi:DUF6541 family protein [Actinophytocola sp. NPDC049390]|uniref:DUF6541 family protein n=1 Tax=Actinophytocola sp. NPDC049390 TaxID=3363894 RepID=UPI0037B5757D
MSWWQLAPAVIVTAAVVFLPGYLVARCWRVTGLVAVGVAAPVSISIVAVVAVFANMVGLRWNVLLVAVAAVVLAGVGLLLRPLLPGHRKHHQRKPVRSRWQLLVHLGALLIPAVVITRGLTKMIGAPGNFSQTYDNIFHLNAVRFILESGSASSLTLGGMYSNGARPSMYPAAWHDLVSLVAQLTGASLPEAVNAVTLVFGALVWPIGAIFLTTRVTGMRPVAVLFAGALSSVFGAFPYLMVDFGVLYPFFMSIALLPAGLALVAMATGVGVRGGTPRWLAMLMLALAVPGIALAHPSTLLVLLLLAIPILVVTLVRYRRRVKAIGKAAELRYWAGVVLMVGYVAVGIVIWMRARPSANGGWWPPIETIPQAIGKVIAAGFSFQGPTWIVLLLTLVAIGLVMRRQITWWLLGMYVIAAGLYVVVAAAPGGRLRNFITGVWYNDPFRLAGQLPVITVVVSTVAAVWLYTVAVDWLAARKPSFERVRSTPAANPVAAAVAFVVAAVMAVAGQYSSVNYEVARGQSTYSLHDDSIVVATDELALMERLDDTIPDGESIIGNPFTGTALAYAFSGRRMLTPHVGGTIPPDVKYVMDNLDEVEDDPEVCSIVRDLRAYWVLDFEGRQVHDRNVQFDGLDSLFTNPGVDEVDHEGLRARLYRITAC